MKIILILIIIAGSVFSQTSPVTIQKSTGNVVNPEIINFGVGKLTINGLVPLTSADLSNKQPLDSDLTNIATLTTNTFGRSLLTASDVSSAYTLLSMGEQLSIPYNYYYANSSGTPSNNNINRLLLNRLANLNPTGNNDGILEIYSDAIPAINVYSKNATGVLSGSTNSQAGKFFQYDSVYTGSTFLAPVVRIWRNNSNAIGPMLEIEDTSINGNYYTAGVGISYKRSNPYAEGPLIRIQDDAAVGVGGPLITFLKGGTIIFQVNNNGEILLKSPNGIFWKLKVDNTGQLSAQQ